MNGEEKVLAKPYDPGAMASYAYLAGDVGERTACVALGTLATPKEQLHWICQ